MSNPFDADPFAPTSPWDEPVQAPQTTSTDNPRPEAPMSDSNKVRVTLKGGKGYDAPWITVDGTSVEDALAQLNKSQAVKELIELTHKVGTYFAGLGDAPKPAPVGPAPTFQNGQLVQQQPQQQAPAPVQQGGYTCAHGQRNFKDGGTWAAYFCGAPKNVDKSQQCPPLWRQKNGEFK